MEDQTKDFLSFFSDKLRNLFWPPRHKACDKYVAPGFKVWERMHQELNKAQILVFNQLLDNMALASAPPIQEKRNMQADNNNNRP